MAIPRHSPAEGALAAVVNDLKKAQDILGSGLQPTPDQLTDARTSLNQAKQDLDYLSPSPERTSLQNRYLQLTQQLLQYTPDSVQQLPALPAPPADPGNPPQTPDAAALTSATAPTWGYPISDDAGSVAPDDSPPPDVPDAPAADWPQPYDPPLTPNLDDLGYYDPPWQQLYGYGPTGRQPSGRCPGSVPRDGHECCAKVPTRIGLFVGASWLSHSMAAGG